MGENMTTNPDDATLVGNLSAGYSVRLAINLVEAYDQPFKRVIEDVRIDHGECRRQLTVDWLLPGLAEALPDHERVDDPDFRKTFAELNPNLVVPVLTLRRDCMMSDFSVLGPSGEQLYICGQDESTHQVRLVLGTLWQWVEAAANAPAVDRELLDKARDDYLALPEKSSKDAQDEASSLKGRLATAGVDLADELSERVLLFGHYVAQHHVIWVRLPRQPGDGVRLTLSYRTRFAADYTPLRGANGLGNYPLWRRAIDCVRRTVGQEPYRFAVPVWMSALCRSYHFQMPAPPSMYFVSQRFTLERNLHQSAEVQQAAFRDHYQGNGAYVGGKDEAGGPVAHLYARDLPATADNKLYAYARVRERPPGSTALVMWLAALTAVFLWFFFVIWASLVESDTQGIDLASLAVALLGVAAIWFSNAFREEVKTRVPLASRIGLLLVGLSTLYSLFTILVRRVTCTDGPEEALVCPSPMSTVFSRWVLLGFAILVSAVVVWLIFRRFRFQREHRWLQKAAIERYMS
jgi:hypothetical protein